MTSWRISESTHVDSLRYPSKRRKISIDILNDDCMLHIFQLLPFEVRIRCERVSKYWRRLSLKSWSTVRELDFRDTLSGLPKAMLSSKSVLSILEHTRDNDIQTFRVPSHYRLNVDLNVFLAIICRTVKEVSFGRLDTYPSPGGLLYTILKSHTPHLKSLDFRGIKTGFCDSLEPHDLRYLTRNIEELYFDSEHLNLEMIYSSKNLKKLHISWSEEESSEAGEDMQIAALMENGIHLEELVTVHDETLTRDLDTVYSSLKKLTILDCNAYAKMGAEDSYHNLCQFPNLEELTLKKAFEFVIEDGSFIDVKKTYSKLKKLTISQDGSESWFYNRLVGEGEFTHEIIIGGVMKEIGDINTLVQLNINMQSNPYFAYRIKELHKLKLLERLSMYGGGATIKDSCLIYLIDELPRLRVLDINGANVKFKALHNCTFTVEEFCSQLTSPRDQVMELRIGGCGFVKNNERDRWMFGQFIIDQTERIQYDSGITDVKFEDDSVSSSEDSDSSSEEEK